MVHLAAKDADISLKRRWRSNRAERRENISGGVKKKKKKRTVNLHIGCKSWIR